MNAAVKKEERPVDEVSGPVSGKDTITIACKLPTGIVMRLNRPIEVRIPMLGRPGEFIVDKMDQPDLDTQYIVAGPLRGDVLTTVGGYALTPGIPRDFAEEWFRQFKDASFVKSGMIFMEGNEQRSRDRAREQEEIRSGYERLNPDFTQKSVRGKIMSVPADPRWPRSTNANVTGIATDTR